MARLIDIIFDLILLIVVARMLVAAFRRFLGSATTRSSQPGPASWQQDKRETVHGETARDPVCGMFVSTELSHRLEWHGKLLHFCSEECLNQYRKSASA
jgi:YHS domain-containing protein